MRSNVGNAFRALLGPFLLRHTPSQLAHGLTLGLLFGLLPKDNLIALILGVGIFWLPCNLGMAVLAGLVGMVLGPSFDSVTSPIGVALLENSALQSTFIAFHQLPIVPWLSLNNSAVMGTVLLAIIVAPVLDLSTMRLFMMFQRIAKQHEFDSLINDTRRYQKSLRAHRRVQFKVEKVALPEFSELDRLHGEHTHPAIPLPHVDHTAPEKRELSPMLKHGETDLDGRSASDRNDSVTIIPGAMVRLDDPESIGPDNMNRREVPSRLTPLHQFAMAGPSAPSHSKQVISGLDAQIGRAAYPGFRVDAPSSPKDSGGHRGAENVRDAARPVDEIGDDSDARSRIGELGTHSTKELESPNQQSELTQLIGIGDLLRETMIEVVRFRPDQSNSPDAALSIRYPEPEPMNDKNRPRLETLDSLSTIPSNSQFSSATPEDSTSRVDQDEPNIYASVGVNAISPMSSPVVAQNPSSVSIQNTVSKQNGSPMTTEEETISATIPISQPIKSPEPAEESLRYLIWHLNSLNREQRS